MISKPQAKTDPCVGYHHPRAMGGSAPSQLITLIIGLMALILHTFLQIHQFPNYISAGVDLRKSCGWPPDSILTWQRKGHPCARCLHVFGIPASQR